ncbi:hypothetical protein NQ318_003698 [Aromia moschata]|uniref:Transposase n=1 Tax=Aromia moschata TaxID=1265417 RepID=A0AAV8YIV4_9CUCU|nr:hypothetical protein NQ318_003698 [Aromia moschata]
MAIKFCVKLEKSAAETIPMLKKAFGVDCLSDVNEDVNEENRAGRPSTSSSDDNVKRVRDLLNTDRRLSVGFQILHHDNAPSHTCFFVADYLVKAGITVVPQPPYSPDKACTDALKAIPENDYRAAFDAWKTRWNRCVDAGGMYFERF